VKMLIGFGNGKKGFWNGEMRNQGIKKREKKNLSFVRDLKYLPERELLLRGRQSIIQTQAIGSYALADPDW